MLQLSEKEDIFLSLWLQAAFEKFYFAKHELAFPLIEQHGLMQNSSPLFQHWYVF